MAWGGKVRVRNELSLKSGSAIPGPAPFEKNYFSSPRNNRGERLARPSEPVLGRIMEILLSIEP